MAITAPDLPGSSGPPPGPEPHILSGPLSREEPIPRLGLVRGRHVSVGAGTRAELCGFPWKTRLPTIFNTVGGARPEATFVRLHCWPRVTNAHSAVAGAAHAVCVSLQCQLDTTARFRPLWRLHGSLDGLRRKLHYLNGRHADGTGEDPPRSKSLQDDEAYPARDSRSL